jgi:hypothetical protein
MRNIIFIYYSNDKIINYKHIQKFNDYDIDDYINNLKKLIMIEEGFHISSLDEFYNTPIENVFDDIYTSTYVEI